MSDDSSDSDPCCEWTLVSGDGQIIGEDESLNLAGSIGVELQHDPSGVELQHDPSGVELQHSTSVEQATEVQEEEKISEVNEGSSITESEVTRNLEELFWRSSSSEVADIDDDAGHSDSGSDIEKLDELPALDVSCHSDFSKYSDLQPQITGSNLKFKYYQDLEIPTTVDKDDSAIQDDKVEEKMDDMPLPDGGIMKPDQFDSSDNSSLQQELPDDLNIQRIRSYRHTPNQQLNVTLNMLLALSITTVIGLGIGHFIGWSSQWIRQNHVQQSQVLKLKMLQDELVTCLQRQHLAQPLSEGVIDFSYYKPCFEQAEYWRHQFNELLSENDDLRDMVMDNNQGSYCREVTEIGDEYQMMKLNLLHKQLDHIETLKQFEMVKRDEKESREQVKLLKDENHDLKTKLDTDGGEVTEDQRVMCHLMKENAKLRLALNDLQPQIPEDVVAEPKDDIIQVEVGSLRQKINQLQLENEDLRQVIARLRYGKPPATPITDAHQNKLNQLETENTDLKVEIGKIRYGKPIGINGEMTEPTETGESDSSDKVDYSNVVQLQEEIKKLRNAFDVEKNQTLKWKELYEKFTRDVPVDDNFKAWVQDNVLSLDVSKFFEVLKSKGVHSREFLELLKQKNSEWLDKLWANMSRATDLLLNKVQETRQQMEEYVNSDKFQLKSGKKLVKKMSKVLHNTMHKFKDATENLLPENFKKSSAKAANKLVDKITGLMNHLNTKWSEITNNLESSPKTTATEENIDDSENDMTNLEEDNSVESDEVDQTKFDNVQRDVKGSRDGNKIVMDDKPVVDKVGDKPTAENKNSSNNLQEPKNGKPKQNDYKHSRSSNDSIGKQGKYKSKDRWTRERRDVRRNVREGSRLDDKHDADWVFRRALYREAKKLKQQQADWLFDRARDRAEQREAKVGIYRDGKPQTDWFFERARDRERSIQERQAKDAVLRDWWFDRAHDREEQRLNIDEGDSRPAVLLRYKNYEDLHDRSDFEDGIVEDDDEDLVYKTSSPEVHYRTQYYAAQHQRNENNDESLEDDDFSQETISRRGESQHVGSDNSQWHFNDELIKVPCDAQKNFPSVYRTVPCSTTSGSHDDRKTYKHPEKEMKKGKARHSSVQNEFKSEVRQERSSQVNCANKGQKKFSRERDCSSKTRWRAEQNRQVYHRQNANKFTRSDRQCCEYDSTNNDVDKEWDDDNTFQRTVVSCNC